MNETDPRSRDPADIEPPERRQSRIEPPNNRALIGIMFAVILVVGAIWLMDRMRAYATMGDCAFTHAPQCRELIGK